MQLKSRILKGEGSGPKLLITGGVHGDEFEPMAAVRRLMALIKPAELRGEVTLVPVVNEAAFERQHRWAEDGLDLARVCPGRPDGSVTERTAHAFSELIRAADFYIDLHTGGTTMSVFPMTGYTLHEDPSVLEHQRGMAEAFNLPFIWGTSGNLDGRSLSVARDANVPAIYTEYQGAATLNPDGIEAYAEGCLNVLGYLEMIHRAPETMRIQHIVEDERDNAGYMQIQNPTPLAGFFEPAVRLGQKIKQGQPIGTVTDVLGEKSVDICAEYDGIVLTLKTFCRVDENDSVGVVVDVDRPLGRR